MSFKDTFCPSPWLHTRINNVGNYEYCRWAVKHDRANLPGITTQSPVHWFQHGMSSLRQQMLDGEKISGCAECHGMEQHSKVSGRQRQLLKIGVTLEEFEKTMLSSPWLNEFKNTKSNNGVTDQLPQDWQIDLGNFCNSACIFCNPHSSSRMASEFKKIGIIDQLPPNSWCDNPDSLALFIKTLEKSPKLAYLHFLGGETLITPAFKIILQTLINNGLSSKIGLGFTTNLTIWDQSIVDLLVQFKEINLGLSIECVNPLNDYVRYGGKIDQTMAILERWLEVARSNAWLSQLRITPTMLSIWHLDTVYEYAMEQELSIESCNFLNDPPFMRPSVLPMEYRTMIVSKLTNWITKYSQATKTIINTRDPNNAKNQVLLDAQSYVNYLINEPDESYRLPDLVDYLKKLEHSRKNNILDYLPEYEQLLRSAGY
jgi:sulfatase maturation enzyme AslB (radical SAM superfamily)